MEPLVRRDLGNNTTCMESVAVLPSALTVATHSSSRSSVCLRLSQFLVAAAAAAAVIRFGLFSLALLALLMDACHWPGCGCWRCSCRNRNCRHRGCRHVSTRSNRLCINCSSWLYHWARNWREVVRRCSRLCWRWWWCRRTRPTPVGCRRSPAQLFCRRLGGRCNRLLRLCCNSLLVVDGLLQILSELGVSGQVAGRYAPSQCVDLNATS